MEAEPLVVSIRVRKELNEQETKEAGEKVADLLHEISKMYRALGGSGIRWTAVEDELHGLPKASTSE